MGMTFVDEIRNAAAAAATNASAVTANATAIAENTTLDGTRNTATLQMITLLESTILGMIRESLFKLPINAATVGSNITLATDLVPGQTLDGVDLVAGYRVLVKDQTDAKENGVYEVKETGGPVRAIDCDDAGEICCAFFPVVNGTTNGGKLFQCTDKTCVIGSSDITIVERAFAV